MAITNPMDFLLPKYVREGAAAAAITLSYMLGEPEPSMSASVVPTSREMPKRQFKDCTLDEFLEAELGVDTDTKRSRTKSVHFAMTDDGKVKTDVVEVPFDRTKAIDWLRPVGLKERFRYFPGVLHNTEPSDDENSPPKTLCSFPAIGDSTDDSVVLMTQQQIAHAGSIGGYMFEPSDEFSYDVELWYGHTQRVWAFNLSPNFVLYECEDKMVM